MLLNKGGVARSPVTLLDVSRSCLKTKEDVVMTAEEEPLPEQPAAEPSKQTTVTKGRRF